MCTTSTSAGRVTRTDRDCLCLDLNIWTDGCCSLLGKGSGWMDGMGE